MSKYQISRLTLIVRAHRACTRAHRFLKEIDRLIKRSEPVFLRLTFFIIFLFGLAKLILDEVHLP